MKTENVLVFPSEILSTCPKIDNGFSADVATFGQAIFNNEKPPFFKSRDEAETDESVKQIIPYVVIRFSRYSGEPKFLTYRRSKKSGETRLHGNFSIGLGGHINDKDSADPIRAFYACVRRELAEEIDVDLYASHPYDLGVIYDDSNSVGRVHFGFVLCFDATTTRVRPLDPSIANPQFLTITELKRLGDQLENWSQIVVANLNVT